MLKFPLLFPLWNAGLFAAASALRLDTAIPTRPAVATAATVETAMMAATAAGGIADAAVAAAAAGERGAFSPAADASEGSRTVVGRSGATAAAGSSAAVPAAAAAAAAASLFLLFLSAAAAAAAAPVAVVVVAAGCGAGATITTGLFAPPPPRAPPHRSTETPIGEDRMPAIDVATPAAGEPSGEDDGQSAFSFGLPSRKTSSPATGTGVSLLVESPVKKAGTGPLRSLFETSKTGMKRVPSEKPSCREFFLFFVCVCGSEEEREKGERKVSKERKNEKKNK